MAIERYCRVPQVSILRPGIVRTPPSCGGLPANALNFAVMDSCLILLVVNAGDEEPRA
jgi:hypothetical protein